MKECAYLASTFIAAGFIALIPSTSSTENENIFDPSDGVCYAILESGLKLAGWPTLNQLEINGKDGKESSYFPVEPFDDEPLSVGIRLSQILEDPAYRLLFREFLRQNYCEENLIFYLEISKFNTKISQSNLTEEEIRDSLARAYVYYNNYLAPGSPSELNLEHRLSSDLARCMTQVENKDEHAMRDTLLEIVGLFEKAKEQVYKLMSSDSLAKFITVISLSTTY
jgi:hypothetical protein